MIGAHPMSIEEEDAAREALDDLGPLADSTPAESALSLLRSAWDKSKMLPWPCDGYVLQHAEDIAYTEAQFDFRHADTYARGRMRNSVGMACYWAFEALQSKAQGDLARETRMAGRVTELLSWMSDDGK